MTNEEITGATLRCVIEQLDIEAKANGQTIKAIHVDCDRLTRYNKASFGKERIILSKKTDMSNSVMLVPSDKKRCFRVEYKRSRKEKKK